MNSITILHLQAMDEADLAFAARRRGRTEVAHAHFQRAYEMESEAALCLEKDIDKEPTRSVYLRSAAGLALECHLVLEAERLICIALTGQPPAPIAEELRDLLEQVNFQRHLDLRGISLEEEEMQMSIGGEGVGFGIASTDAFLERVQDTEKLLHRTAERFQQKPYRGSGQPDKETKDLIALYMSEPRAASFAVTFKVGGPQFSIPGLSKGKEIVDEMLRSLELYAQPDKALLKDHIPDEAYYNNFVGLARRISPDKKTVSVVGFTTIRDGKVRKVALTARPEGALVINSRVPANRAQPLDEPINFDHITGVLRFADGRKAGKDEIRIVDDNGTSHRVVVPAGLMDDIVRPLWGLRLTATGKMRGKTLHLQDINPAES